MLPGRHASSASCARARRAFKFASSSRPASDAWISNPSGVSSSICQQNTQYQTTLSVKAASRGGGREAPRQRWRSQLHPCSWNGCRATGPGFGIFRLHDAPALIVGPLSKRCAFTFGPCNRYCSNKHTFLYPFSRTMLSHLGTMKLERSCAGLLFVALIAAAEATDKRARESANAGIKMYVFERASVCVFDTRMNLHTQTLMKVGREETLLPGFTY